MTSAKEDVFGLKIKRLRFALFTGACWFVFVIVLPDTVYDTLQWGVHRNHPLLDTMSIILLSSLMLYMMVQTATLTKVIFPVLGGIFLLAISEVFRIFGGTELLNANFTSSWAHAIRTILLSTANDLGLVLLISGLLYAIIELLRTRHIAHLQHQQLQDEMADRKRAEAEVEEHRLHMVTASRMSSLGSMASGLGHEIKNPLAVISGTCQQLESLVQGENPDPKLMTRSIAIIHRNVERIDRIVRGLRRLSRDEQGEAVTTVPLETIVADTLELCQTRFRENGIVLDVSSVPRNVQTECRSTEISQVLLNLLSNAFDALRSSSEKWVRIEAVDKAGSVEIAVTDSGPGIPPGLRDRVFDPFFTTKPPGEGIGVGLSISKRIMDAHEGALFLDPESSRTRFVVRIPKRHGSKH